MVFVYLKNMEKFWNSKSGLTIILFLGMSAIKANSIEITFEDNKLAHGDLSLANEVSSSPTQIFSFNDIVNIIFACHIVEYEERKKREHPKESDSSDDKDSDYANEEESETKRVKRNEDSDFALKKKTSAKGERKKYRSWTDEEERILLDEVNKFVGRVKWTEVAKKLPGWTNKDCSNKYKRLMKTSC